MSVLSSMKPRKVRMREFNQQRPHPCVVDSSRDAATLRGIATLFDMLELSCSEMRFEQVVIVDELRMIAARMEDSVLPTEMFR